MKARLTLTVDPHVSHRAKIVARQQGTSLSAMVEKFLAEISGAQPARPNCTFSQRWRGKIQLSDSTDERSARLRLKYKLTKYEAQLITILNLRDLADKNLATYFFFDNLAVIKISIKFPHLNFHRSSQNSSRDE